MKYNEKRVEYAKGNYDEDSERKMDRRYLLKIKLKRANASKSILFIMMNPAEANDDNSDMTIQKIINYVYENRCKNPLLIDCKEINIVNAYVMYTPYPKVLDGLIQQYGEVYCCGNEEDDKRNNKTIREQVDDNDIIIFACGKAEITNYNIRVEEIKNILRDSNKIVYSVGTLTEDGYPRHMSRIDYSYDLQKMDI